MKALFFWVWWSLGRGPRYSFVYRGDGILRSSSWWVLSLCRTSLATYSSWAILFEFGSWRFLFQESPQTWWSFDFSVHLFPFCQLLSSWARFFSSVSLATHSCFWSANTCRNLKSDPQSAHQPNTVVVCRASSRWIQTSGWLGGIALTTFSSKPWPKEEHLSEVVTYFCRAIFSRWS